MRSLGKRLGISSLIAAVMFVGFAGNSFAEIEDEEESTEETVSTSAPTFSLTIHKHQQGETLGEANYGGKEISPAPANPIKGVEFSIRRVTDVDLSTNAGWAKANETIQAFKENPTIDASRLAAEQTATTDDQGVAAFSNISKGLYLVTEKNWSAATTPSGTKLNLIPAKPFLVTLPTTLDEGTGDGRTQTINRNVHVYPKNDVAGITKTVADKNKSVGDYLTYTVRTDIPLLPEGKNLDKYVIIDPLASVLTYDATAGNVPVLGVYNGETELEALVADTHYTVSYDAAKHLLKATFTPEGLQVLTTQKRANGNAQVEMVFGAKLGELPATSNGIVHNTAYLAPSSEFSDTPVVPDGGIPPTTPENPTPEKPTWPTGTVPPPSNEVITKFGRISFLKVNGNDTSEIPAALQGAQFKLSYCATPTTFLTINGKNVWESDAEGAFTIEGLHVSDFANNAAVTANTASPEYCLHEVRAPEGFELLPEPIKFNVTNTGDYAVQAFGTSIKNYPRNGGGELPLTGAQGLALFGGLGMSLVGGGSFLLWRNRRKEEK